MRLWAAAGLGALMACGAVAAQDVGTPPVGRPAAAKPSSAERPVERPRPPDQVADTSRPALQAQGKGRSQGALIPPGAVASPLANGAEVPPSTQADQPAAPAGPSVPDSLRETDFDFAACRLALFQLGAQLRDVPSVLEPERGDCGIARPVEVAEIARGVVLEGGATMRCDTALALARWTREVVQPAARHLAGSPRLTALGLGTGYQCRAVVGNGTPDKTSEHAFGNAIDVAAFVFDDGTRVQIAPAADRGDLTVAFQNAVQGAACLFFATVLGPGSNAAHDDHLHLDIKARRGGFRLCQ